MSDILLYTFIGIALVLLVLNASNAAGAITLLGGTLITETKAITGNGAFQ